MTWIDITYTPKPFTKVPKKHLKKRKAKLSRKQKRLLNPPKKKLVDGTRLPKTKQEYTMYVHSPQWKDRKDKYWREHGKFCRACNSKKGLTVHHVHYGYLGREKDEHIIGLCWDCHRDFHSEYGTKTVMQEETLEFIEKKHTEFKHTHLKEIQKNKSEKNSQWLLRSVHYQN